MAEAPKLSAADVQRLSEQLKALQGSLEGFQFRLAERGPRVAEQELVALNKTIQSLRAEWRRALELPALH